MKRKNKKRPSAIFTADWHIRGDRPICRTDNCIDAQGQKILFIQGLAIKYKCPILIAGDIGHKPMWGDKLLNWFIERTNQARIIVTAGQHDLPNHRLDKWEEAGIGVLSKSLANFEVELEGAFLDASSYIRVSCFPYGEKIQKSRLKGHKRTIALAHQMVIKNQKNKLWPDQQAQSARRLLKKFPCYDVIVTGDNHQSFVVEYEGRLLVNPGSMMRMSANQIAHEPSIYLWYAETNTVERVRLPIEQGVVNREHIEVTEQRNRRIESFVKKLKEIHPGMKGLGIDYEINMEEFLKLNMVRKRVIEKVWESME